jgi:2-polyprenyl-3-methyl-5-hydroxy-6-metoxy-1,4-benzoquinol methylase
VPVVRSSLEQLVRGCEVYRQTGCWLDVGFGEGALLDVAESLGWQCYGTEVAPQSLEYGRTRGWTVAECSEHDARFVWGGFDVVTMIELIEHVPEPERCLANACRLLRPGGLLYVTTPNAGSLNRRVLGAEWSVFAPPEHLTIWSAAGLRTALARNGLQVQSVRTEGLNPSELVSRLRRHGAQAASRNEAGFALNEKFSSSRWRRGLKSKINSGLCLFGIGDTLKVRATRLATAK